MLGQLALVYQTLVLVLLAHRHARQVLTDTNV